MTRAILALLAFAILAPLASGQDTAPQDGAMVHMDGSGSTLRYVPEHVVVVPGGTVQLMIFGQGHGRYSLTLDDDPSREADVDTSAEGVVHVGEFAAPLEPGEYAFHDRYHEGARGVLVVQRGPLVVGVGNGYDTRFYPDRFEVEAGATLVFRNNASEIVHTMTAADGAFDTDLVRPGETRTLVAPTAPGEHAFFCKYHADSGMRGVLVVRPSAHVAESGERAATPGLALPVAIAALAALALLTRRAR